MDPEVFFSGQHGGGEGGGGGCCDVIARWKYSSLFGMGRNCHAK